MTDFTINLEDSTEPVQQVIHTVSIEYSKGNEEIKIIETIYDTHNSSYIFDDADSAEWISDKLEMSPDELMDACIDVIHKNGV